VFYQFNDLFILLELLCYLYLPCSGSSNFHQERLLLAEVLFLLSSLKMNFIQKQHFDEFMQVFYCEKQLSKRLLLVLLNQKLNLVSLPGKFVVK
jgi:hypothetical protein